MTHSDIVSLSGGTLPPISMPYLVDTLVALCRIPSPTGMAGAAIDYIEKALDELNVSWTRTPKGALVATLPGQITTSARTLSAHVDTLGAVVKEIKPNGRLKLSQVGGSSWGSIEGEHCLVHTLDGLPISGTILHVKSSTHIHRHDEDREERTADSFEVRLNERTSSAEQTRALGIDVGDFISYDARTTVTPAGFITSRHLDDKACAAILLALAKSIKDHGILPSLTTHLFFSNYEEVGHGACAGIPQETRELIAVDMAVVGQGQTSDEFSVTVCSKDASGPYDHDLSRHLRRLARQHGIPCHADVYIHYASDASAALEAGGAFRAACIGPGIDASHSHERAHEEGLAATTRLLLAYLFGPEGFQS